VNIAKTSANSWDRTRPETLALNEPNERSWRPRHDLSGGDSDWGTENVAGPRRANSGRAAEGWTSSVAESAGRKELPPQKRVPPAPTRSLEQQTARDSASDQRHDELATPPEPPWSTRQISHALKQIARGDRRRKSRVTQILLHTEKTWVKKAPALQTAGGKSWEKQDRLKKTLVRAARKSINRAALLTVAKPAQENQGADGALLCSEDRLRAECRCVTELFGGGFHPQD
jgi:hypothetical protein